VVRAALESIAYQTRDCIERMRSEAGIPLRTLRVDGGAAQNNFLMQFQSDILGVPVERTRSQQLTALGAAALAGIGSGLWRDTSPLKRLAEIDRKFTPKMSKTRRAVLYAGWKRAVACTRSY